MLSPAAAARRSRALVWTLRAFYFVVIVNAAVIFAVPGRRWMGIGVVAALILAWTVDMKEVKSVKVVKKT